MATGESAFYANYGRHPNLFTVSKNSPQAVAALKDTKQLKQLHNKILKNIEYN